MAKTYNGKMVKWQKGKMTSARESQAQESAAKNKATMAKRARKPKIFILFWVSEIVKKNKSE
jgi:hypothetical protein